MNYDEWVKTVPDEIRGDNLWTMTVYRQALFLGDLAWRDATKLAQDHRTLKLSGQLYDSVGGISATIAEGYSRASDRDQARFYEYALGSSRESRDWYYKGRYVLSDEVAMHRIRIIVHITKQLLKVVPEHRTRALREELASYETSDHLFRTVPMPD